MRIMLEWGWKERDMNRKQNKIMSVTAVVAMFLLIIAMLLTSFQLVIYGDPEYRFYEKEYEKYTVFPTAER